MFADHSLSSCPAARKKLDRYLRISGVWQLARLKTLAKALDLTLEVYRCTRDFPRQEFNGFTDQMRRAAVSIASNIAEGKGRSTDRDFANFLLPRSRLTSRT